LLALTGSAPLAATTVYRSVDDQGVVHFSDSRPDGRPADILHIDTPPAQPVADQQQRLRELRDTTDRMVADRRARERHRAALRRERATLRPPVPRNEALPRYKAVPVFFGSHGRALHHGQVGSGLHAGHRLTGAERLHRLHRMHRLHRLHRHTLPRPHSKLRSSRIRATIGLP